MENGILEDVEGRAYARAGLLGNPSDGYGGKAIAVSVYDFVARVRITPSDRIQILAGDNRSVAFDSLRAASEFYGAADCDGGARPLSAAIARFRCFANGLAKIPPGDPRMVFSISFETTIPRQVGLAGSSAVIVAALRALSTWFDVDVPRFDLAELALQAELEDLGNAAGPMDRVIQAYEGCMAMELRDPRSEKGYTRLDPKRLPPLAIAWVPDGGEVSGRAHGDLRARWLARDTQVLETVEALRALVDLGVECLRNVDHDGFRRLVDRNFELRNRIYDVSAPDHDMVSIARGFAASAKLCGSGGAVLVVPSNKSDMDRIENAYRERGYATIIPNLVPDGDELR